MNIYVVVEGRVSEKAAYRVWIPKINQALSAVALPADVENNHFCIVSGNGYPQYFDIVLAALQDVTSDDRFDRLVICIDSEDMTLEEKQEEVTQFVEGAGYGAVDYRVVVQHFCFEAWALGNRRIGREHPETEPLRTYRRVYNVRSQDPEGLPPRPEENLNRSQFAEKYLRVTLNDRNKRLTYSKNNPRVVAHPKYFLELQKRLAETRHIASFQAFMDAFV